MKRNGRTAAPRGFVQHSHDLHALAVVVDKLPIVDASPDPDDNYLLAIAAAGAADFLVTGDKRDLLALRVYEGTKITTTRTFLTQYG
jgi:predicted nucleic acid-binding protein